MRDALDISFFDDFTDVFDEAMTFDVAFGYSRGNYRKMHKAVELAVKRLSEKILFPHDIDAANAAQIDVQLGGDDELMLNGVPIPWFQKHLDTSQKAAVVRALRAEFNPMPTIIHGPPGTGKTTTLIEIILHVFTQLPENRMLVAAHSNSAANLLLRRLIEYDFLHESIVRVVGICYQEKGTLDAALEPYCVCLDSKDHPGENDIKVKMLKDTSELAPFRIIIGTCVGFGALMFDRTLPDFAHVIIDEAGQCTEPEALIPILRVNATNGSVILAGDQMQMAPLILSKHARMHGLSLSLLERLIGVYASFEVQSKVKAREYICIEKNTFSFVSHRIAGRHTRQSFFGFKIGLQLPVVAEYPGVLQSSFLQQRTVSHRVGCRFRGVQNIDANARNHSRQLEAESETCDFLSQCFWQKLSDNRIQFVVQSGRMYCGKIDIRRSCFAMFNEHIPSVQ